MIAVISPAKSLEFEEKKPENYSLPRMTKETKTLVNVLQEKEPDDLKDLMSISDNLAELNAERFQAFKQKHNAANSRPCILTFNGEVYRGLNAVTLSEEDLEFAQNHLRVLSGLYGVLRPKDLIQPYRLEMGTKLGFDDYRTLYEFWGDKISKMLKNDLKSQGDNIIVNLASNEYFSSVNRKKLKARIIDVEFKDFKNGEYKIISVFAKKARGLMSRFIIDKRISDPEKLKLFEIEGYSFDANSSEENKLVFIRG